MGETAFATVMRRLRRVPDIAGVLATLGVTVSRAQAAQPATTPDLTHGHAMGLGTSFGQKL